MTEPASIRPATVVRPDGRRVVMDLAWAKPSCKRCHGTGLWGTLLKQGGKVRERIICACVEKEWARRQRAQAAKELCHG